MSFQKLSSKITAPIGRTHHLNPPMHAIILVEQFNVKRNGDLEVIALLENEGSRSGLSYIDKAPDVAPLRAKTTIYKDCLPPGRTFKGHSNQQLAEIIDEYKLFLHQHWEPLAGKVDSDGSDKPSKGGRLFF